MWPGRGKGLKSIGIGVVGDTALGRRLGGDFRLMPQDEGRHILAFSRNDGPVRVLDIGDADALQDCLLYTSDAADE